MLTQGALEERICKQTHSEHAFWIRKITRQVVQHAGPDGPWATGVWARRNPQPQEGRSLTATETPESLDTQPHTAQGAQY